MGVSDIIAFAQRMAPTTIGLNCHTLNRHVVYEIVRSLRVVLPHALLVLGGAHPASAPHATFAECRQIDIIVEGEGEVTLHEIVTRPEEYRGIPGLYFSDNGIVGYTGARRRIKNLDDLPFPDLDGVPAEIYFSYEDPQLPGLWKRAYLSASRGCRYKCSYCTENVHWGGGTTFRSASSILAEMACYRERYGVNRFYFYDDTLTDWRDLGTFCDLAGRIESLWSCSTRVDHMSPELDKNDGRWRMPRNRIWARVRFNAVLARDEEGMAGRLHEGRCRGNNSCMRRCRYRRSDAFYDWLSLGAAIGHHGHREVRRLIKRIWIN